MAFRPTRTRALIPTVGREHDADRPPVRRLAGASETYQVEVTDSRGQRQEATAEVLVAEPGEKPLPPKRPDPRVVPSKPVAPPKPDLNASGPLAQALAELWEKARTAKIDAVEKIVIKFFDAAATWKVHQAMATLRDAEINCHFEADIKLEGVNTFQLDFDGRMDKANTVKSFLDPQLRTAADTTSRAPTRSCSRPLLPPPWTGPTPSRGT